MIWSAKFILQMPSIFNAQAWALRKAKLIKRHNDQAHQPLWKAAEKRSSAVPCYALPFHHG